MDVSSLPSATFDKKILSSTFAERTRVNVFFFVFSFCVARYAYNVRSQSEQCSMSVRSVSHVVADVMAGGVNLVGFLFRFFVQGHTRPSEESDE